MRRLAAALALALAAHGRAVAQADAGARPGAAPKISLPALQNGAVAAGWTDLGWAQRTLAPGHPAKVDFSGFSGWILLHAELKPAELGGLLVRLKAPESFGSFLEVGLDSRSHAVFPRVRASPESARPQPDGFVELWLSMDALDPLDAPFDRVVLRSVRAVPSVPVELDTIAFTAGAPPTARERAAERTPPRKATVTLDCARARPISPLIYGVSFGDAATAWELGASARRWGGNPSSRYNWKLGNAWNTGHDWFFRNVDITSTNGTWTKFLDEDRAHGAATAFVLPMIGWVAKDTRSCSFPVATFGEQKKVDPESHRCGNGIGAADGSELAPGTPGLTSIPAPPQFDAEWVKAIRARNPGPPPLYFLDNEPTLWHDTHRDVHPQRLGYDELLSKTIDYATAAKDADPQARIAGFVAWGWSALFFSAADKTEKGEGFAPMDRLSHGGKQLLPWWLSQVHAHEAKTGRRIVDLVDVHFYPQANGMGLYSEGWTDAESAARRIRSVRGLWDPSYKDESWIGEPMRLIPRLKAWIEAQDPGLGISIGEYNFGAEGHISGGLAVAEALGRFGQFGVEAAFYWPLPPRGSAAYWGFRAFRNYDGKGGKAGDTYVPSSSTDKGLSAVFASRRADGSLVLVALNQEAEKSLELSVDPGSCGPSRIARVFSYAGEEMARSKDAADGGVRLAPWSINVIEMTR